MMKKQPPHLIPSRLAKRADYDRATLNAILDEALYCTVSYSVDNRPFSIPTSFVRYGNDMYIHGSVGSHFIKEIEKGIPVCISVTLMDAIVVAKSAFHHSINYRSVTLFSTARKIENHQDKVDAFEWLTNKIVPDSWPYLRPIKESEVRKTIALAFAIDEASAKIRTGMPNDEEEDKPLPIWSGIIPLHTQRMKPEPDQTSLAIPLPPHLE